MMTTTKLLSKSGWTVYNAVTNNQEYTIRLQSNKSAVKLSEFLNSEQEIVSLELKPRVTPSRVNYELVINSINFGRVTNQDFKTVQEYINEKRNPQLQQLNQLRDSVRAKLEKAVINLRPSCDSTQESDQSVWCEILSQDESQEKSDLRYANNQSGGRDQDFSDQEVSTIVRFDSAGAHYFQDLWSKVQKARERGDHFTAGKLESIGKTEIEILNVRANIREIEADTEAIRKEREAIRKERETFRAMSRTERIDYLRTEAHKLRAAKAR